MINWATTYQALLATWMNSERLDAPQQTPGDAGNPKVETLPTESIAYSH